MNTRISISIGGNWRSYVATPLPFGATAIGTVTCNDDSTGALVRTPLGYYQLNAKAMRKLPQRTVLRAVAKAAVDLLPQITGARGGRAGKGKAKTRGDSEYYRRLRAQQ